jgi:hypothetical protein
VLIAVLNWSLSGVDWLLELVRPMIGQPPGLRVMLLWMMVMRLLVLILGPNESPFDPQFLVEK